MSHTLCVIPISHYCEIARWALQVSEKDFTEKQALPGLHLVLLPSRPDGKKLTPYMKKPDGTWLLDSWSILEYCEIGEPVPDDIKDVLNKDVGVCIRAIVYSHILYSDALSEMLSNASYGQKISWALVGRLIMREIGRGIVKSPEHINN